MVIAGIILAGGLSRRLGGGDKCLRPLAGRSILARIVERMQGQVAALAINANGEPDRFATFGLPVVPDSAPGFPGPLAGILAGLDWAARSVPGATHVASVAGDSPFVPRDLVARLAAALTDGAAIASAASAGQSHPVFGLWPVASREALRRGIVDERLRQVGQWIERHRHVTVDFAVQPVDPFFNVNRAEDLAEAERLLRGLASPS